MGILSRIFSGRRSQATAEAPACPHKALVPRWERPEDIGKEELVVSYLCSACGQSFSREEARSYLGQL